MELEHQEDKPFEAEVTHPAIRKSDTRPNLDYENDPVLKGAHLASLAIGTNALLYSYPDNIVEVAKNLVPQIEALEIMAVRLQADKKLGGKPKDEKAFVEHCQKLELGCEKIFKGSKSEEEQKDTVKALWRSIRKTPPIISAAMGYKNLQTLAQPKLKGEDNPFIPIMTIFAESRDAIDKQYNFSAATYPEHYCYTDSFGNRAEIETGQFWSNFQNIAILSFAAVAINLPWNRLGAIGCGLYGVLALCYKAFKAATARIEELPVFDEKSPDEIENFFNQEIKPESRIAVEGREPRPQKLHEYLQLAELLNAKESARLL